MGDRKWELIETLWNVNQDNKKAPVETSAN